MRDCDQVLDSIARRIAGSPRIDFGTYRYFVWPYKGITPIDPRELSLIVSLLASRVPPKSELLFTFQTDGEILAVPLALEANKPLIVCRDIPYRMTNPLVITQHTRYWTRNLYCDRIPPNCKVVIIEAIISTGNTVIEAVRQIRNCGAEVGAVITAVSKPDYRGEERIKRETGIETSVLLRVTDVPDSPSLKVEWSI